MFVSGHLLCKVGGEGRVTVTVTDTQRMKDMGEWKGEEVEEMRGGGRRGVWMGAKGGEHRCLV